MGVTQPEGIGRHPQSPVERQSVKPAERIAGITRLFVDTATVIYFVEKNPSYYPRVLPIFQAIDAGRLTAVTSVVTLSECLVHPYRLSLAPVAEAFTQLITAGANTSFVVLDREVA